MVCRLRFPTSRDLLMFVLLVLSSTLWSVPASAQAEKLVVFAAASLKDALDEVNAAFQR